MLFFNFPAGFELSRRREALDCGRLGFGIWLSTCCTTGCHNPGDQTTDFQAIRSFMK